MALHVHHPDLQAKGTYRRVFGYPGAHLDIHLLTGSQHKRVHVVYHFVIIVAELNPRLRGAVIVIDPLDEEKTLYRHPGVDVHDGELTGGDLGAGGGELELGAAEAQLSAEIEPHIHEQVLLSCITLGGHL